MAFTFNHSDPSRPAGEVSFRCSACGYYGCYRTTVGRPDGSVYTTEFVACSACKLLYHHKGALPDYGPPKLHSSSTRPAGADAVESPHVLELRNDPGRKDA